MAYGVTAVWHAKPDKADRVAAVVQFQPGLLEDRERLFSRSVAEA